MNNRYLYMNESVHNLHSLIVPVSNVEVVMLQIEVNMKGHNFGRNP